MTSRHRHVSQRMVSMTSLLLAASAMSLLTCVSTRSSPFNPKRKSRVKPPLDIRPHYNQIFQVERLKDKILRGLNLTTEPQSPAKKPAQSIHSVLNRLPPPRNRTRTRPRVPDTIVWSEPVAANTPKADQLLFRVGSQKKKSSVINRVTLLLRLRFTRHSKSKNNGKVRSGKRTRGNSKKGPKNGPKNGPKVKSLDVQNKGGSRKSRGKKKSKQKKNKFRSKRKKSRRVKLLVQAVNEETGKFKRVVVQRVTVIKKFTWIKIPIPVSLVSRAAQSDNQSLVLRIRCRRCLKTGVTIDNALPRKKSRKANPDSGSFVNLNPNRPYMVICTADTPLNAQASPSLPRSARHVNRDCSSQSSQPEFSCCSEEVEVVFKDIGWDHWIVRPKSFTTVVCNKTIDRLCDRIFALEQTVEKLAKSKGKDKVQTTKLNGATYALVGAIVILAVSWLIGKLQHQSSGDVSVTGKLPPHIPSSIPFLGHAVSFGQSPIEFLLAAHQKYGPVFSFTMVGKTFTYLVGSDAAALFFNSRNENLNAEEVYSRLTTPVFGKGVAYDCPNSLFLEQKKMFKTGLNIARFREHVHLIEEETVDYFKRWGKSGEKNLFVAMSEVIILTASRCLHGKEIRAKLDESMARLYMDLDGGFTHEAWLLPGWLPLPSFRKRDKAHQEVKRIFYEVIQQRRDSKEPEDDMLQTLIDSRYKSGRNLTDDEIAGMLIGLLLAGQHTSSTTSTWLLFFLAKHPDIQEAVLEEQRRVCGGVTSDGQWPPLDYDTVKDLQLLDRCLKETLRLRPPIMTMMRMCKTPQTVMGYTIPPGHQVCVSPTTNHCLPDTWKDMGSFEPDRFLDPDVANSEKFAYVPFGAGRHRCIGESFAYAQIKTAVSTLLRHYRLELVGGYFPEVDFTTMIHTPKTPIVRYSPRTL
ncbi:hypothetical protein ACOMHN_062459 [Nucella lapillus]